MGGLITEWASSLFLFFFAGGGSCGAGDIVSVLYHTVQC